VPGGLGIQLPKSNVAGIIIHSVLDHRAIQIHTDGSCYKNPGGISGCAAYVRYPDEVGLAEEQIVDFGCGESSNNRMELMACVKALDWALENAPWPYANRIYIVTDSQYLANCYSSAQYWKKDGWRNKSGEPTANEDLWDKILKSVGKLSKLGVRVDFVYQKGKKTEIAKKVDNAAKTAAQRGGIDEDSGYKPGSFSRSMVRDGTATQRFPAAGQVLVIRPYVKKPRKKREERISFNVLDEATQSYNGKFFAYAIPSLAAELHRGNGYRVRFNSDPLFPQILEKVEEVPLPKPTRKKKGRPRP
jgi:ribonuclease HI